MWIGIRFWFFFVWVWEFLCRYVLGTGVGLIILISEVFLSGGCGFVCHSCQGSVCFSPSKVVTLVATFEDFTLILTQLNVIM